MELVYEVVCEHTGLEYGEKFQLVKRLNVDGDCLAHGIVEIEKEEASNFEKFHPSIMDCCLQVGAYIRGIDTDGFIPDKVESVELKSELKSVLRNNNSDSKVKFDVFAKMGQVSGRDLIVCDVEVFAKDSDKMLLDVKDQ